MHFVAACLSHCSLSLSLSLSISLSLSGLLVALLMMTAAAIYLVAVLVDITLVCVRADQGRGGGTARRGGTQAVSATEQFVTVCRKSRKTHRCLQQI